MKIKDTFKYVFIIIFLVFGFLMFGIWNLQVNINKKITRIQYTEKLSTEVTKSSLHLHEYLLRFEERPVEQLYKHQKKLDEILVYGAKQLPVISQIDNFKIIHRNNNLIKLDLKHLLEFIGSVNHVQHNSKFKRLVSQILIKSYIIIDASSQMKETFQKEIRNYQIYQNRLIIISFLLVFALFLILFLFMYKNIILPILSISNKITEVKPENMEFNVKITKKK